MQELTLLKLGGGLIAPKNWKSETIDEEVLERLVREIKEVVQVGRMLVVVCGSGNFGHHAVVKYGIADELGVEEVRKSARKIGEKVVQVMKKHGIGCRLVVTNKILNIKQDTDEDKKLGDLIKKSVISGEILVFFGDVLGNSRSGWQIFSGEKILTRLVGAIASWGKVDKIVQVGIEQGVLDKSRQVVGEINIDNWPEIRGFVGGSAGVDVTGGMLTKVEESLDIAREFGVETWIVSGKFSGRMKAIISGKRVEATKIGI